ncbi:MAG: 30S ribosomal protein S1 [Mariprofundales bacterium]
MTEHNTNELDVEAKSQAQSDDSATSKEQEQADNTLSTNAVAETSPQAITNADTNADTDKVAAADIDSDNERPESAIDSTAESSTQPITKEIAEKVSDDSSADSDEEDKEKTEAKEEENMSFADMLDASLGQQNNLRRGELVTGVVAAIDTDLVFVDIGAKGEGTVPFEEFARLVQSDLPKVGDEIEVLVKDISDRNGVQISILDALRYRGWKKIEEANANGENLRALIEAEKKGGYRVNCGGVQGFMPYSESALNPRQVKSSTLLGNEFDVAIIEISRRPENLVVSRRKILQAERELKRKAFFDNVAIGSKVTGTVRRLTDFGAFIDLGVVDALLHVSDITWRRLKHPSEVLQSGQEIEAEITKLDAENGKISVSLRALLTDPWTTVIQKYNAGDRVKGTVRRLEDFGAMIELEDGVEGMAHRSELSWMKADVPPTQVLAENDQVEVAIISVDAARRRIALSLKQVLDNPWESFLKSHPPGTHISGRVRAITDFGMFVSATKELDGLVHASNLSWTKRSEEALKAYKKGQEVECVVLGVDTERQRVSFGIKQLEDDPFTVFVSGASKGGAVNGTVIETQKAGYVIKVAEGVLAFLPQRQLARDQEALHPDDKIEAKVIEMDKKRRRIVLSVRQWQNDEQRATINKYKNEQSNDHAPSALALELQRKVLKKQKSK